MQALQAHGYVEQDRNSGKYQPGVGLLQLGTSYLDLDELALARWCTPSGSPSDVLPACASV